MHAITTKTKQNSITMIARHVWSLQATPLARINTSIAIIIIM